MRKNKNLNFEKKKCCFYGKIAKFSPFNYNNNLNFIPRIKENNC